MAKPNVSAQRIQKLRERTGAGIIDCKRALEEAGGDLERAVMLLRERGQKVAQAKQERLTREGQVGVYVHSNGKVAALVSVACETDFVARTDDFKTLAHDLALHVTALNPRYLKPENVPPDVVEAERQLYRRQLEGQRKPAAVQEKIIAGKLEKFYAEACLLRQPFVKDDSMTVEDLLKQAVAKLGENIQVTDFCRLTIV